VCDSVASVCVQTQHRPPPLQRVAAAAAASSGPRPPAARDLHQSADGSPDLSVFLAQDLRGWGDGDGGGGVHVRVCVCVCVRARRVSIILCLLCGSCGSISVCWVLGVMIGPDAVVAAAALRACVA